MSTDVRCSKTTVREAALQFVIMIATGFCRILILATVKKHCRMVRCCTIKDIKSLEHGLPYLEVTVARIISAKLCIEYDYSQCLRLVDTFICLSSLDVGCEIDWAPGIVSNMARTMERLVTFKWHAEWSDGEHERKNCKKQEDLQARHVELGNGQIDRGTSIFAQQSASYTAAAESSKVYTKLCNSTSMRAASCKVSMWA